MENVQRKTGIFFAKILKTTHQRQIAPKHGGYAIVYNEKTRFFHKDKRKSTGKTLPTPKTFDRMLKCHFGCKGGLRAWLMFVLYAAKESPLEFKSATLIFGQSGLGNQTCSAFVRSWTVLPPGSEFAPDAYVPAKFSAQCNESKARHFVGLFSFIPFIRSLPNRYPNVIQAFFTLVTIFTRYSSAFSQISWRSSPLNW